MLQRGNGLEVILQLTSELIPRQSHRRYQFTDATLRFVWFSLFTYLIQRFLLDIDTGQPS